jgi:hypothetical protein
MHEASPDMGGNYEQIQCSDTYSRQNAIPPSWGLDWGLKAPHCKEVTFYEMLHKDPKLHKIFTVA